MGLAVELRQLQYFLAVARELHFTRAAEKLYVTQSALTRQIQQLEQDLGVPLFVRDTRRVELTDAGRVLQEEAERILKEVDRAIQLARSAGCVDGRELRIGYSPFLDLHLVSEVRMLCQNCHPDVPINFVSALTISQVEALLEGTIHIGIVTLPISDDAIATECICREPLLVAIKTAHPLARKRQIRAADLSGEPIVWMPQSMHPAFFRQFFAWCAEVGFNPHIVQEVTTVPELLEFVREGVGVSFVNTPVIKLRMDGVAFRPLVDPPYFVETGVAYRKDTRSETVIGLLSAIRRKFTSHQRPMGRARSDRKGLKEAG